MAATRAIIAARRGAPDVISLQELHRNAREHTARAAPGGDPGDVTGTTQHTPTAGADRVLAPFGTRPVAIVAHERHGAYHVLRCADPLGPRPRAGQFYMLATVRRWGGGASQRPFVPRAFSVLRAPAGHRRAAVHARRRRPGHRAAVRADSSATSCRSSVRWGSASRRRVTAARRCWSAAASGSRRWRSGRTSSAARRRCSASATPSTRAARRCSTMPADRHRRRLGRAPRPRHRAARRPAAGRR